MCSLRESHLASHRPRRRSAEKISPTRQAIFPTSLLVYGHVGRESTPGHAPGPAQREGDQYYGPWLWPRNGPQSYAWGEMGSNTAIWSLPSCLFYYIIWHTIGFISLCLLLRESGLSQKLFMGWDVNYCICSVHALHSYLLRFKLRSNIYP